MRWMRNFDPIQSADEEFRIRGLAGSGEIPPFRIQARPSALIPLPNSSSGLCIGAKSRIHLAPQASTLQFHTGAAALT